MRLEVEWLGPPFRPLFKILAGNDQIDPVNPNVGHNSLLKIVVCSSMDNLDK